MELNYNQELKRLTRIKEDFSRYNGQVISHLLDKMKELKGYVQSAEQMEVIVARAFDRGVAQIKREYQKGRPSATTSPEFVRSSARASQIRSISLKRKMLAENRKDVKSGAVQDALTRIRKPGKIASPTAVTPSVLETETASSPLSPKIGLPVSNARNRLRASIETPDIVEMRSSLRKKLNQTHPKGEISTAPEPMLTPKERSRVSRMLRELDEYLELEGISVDAKPAETSSFQARQATSGRDAGAPAVERYKSVLRKKPRPTAR